MRKPLRNRTYRRLAYAIYTTPKKMSPKIFDHLCAGYLVITCGELDSVTNHGTKALTFRVHCLTAVTNETTALHGKGLSITGNVVGELYRLPRSVLVVVFET
jgi:hypothetical protein